MSDYITVAGIVQFDPRTRQAGDKQVRDVAIRSIADQKMYNVTLWPEKSNVAVTKGDFIVADGKYSSSVGQNKAGEQVTWHNLSANTFHNLVSGAAAPSESAAKPAATGDDFPF
jgi:hypothetical protein